MDQKASEDAARAAAAVGFHVGHVFVRHELDDMYIKSLRAVPKKLLRTTVTVSILKNLCTSRPVWMGENM